MKLNKDKVLLAIAKKEMKQSELADKAKMSRGNLSTIINGKNCRAETVIRLAKILDVPADEIIEIEK